MAGRVLNGTRQKHICTCRSQHEREQQARICMTPNHCMQDLFQKAASKAAAADDAEAESEGDKEKTEHKLPKRSGSNSAYSSSDDDAKDEARSRGSDDDDLSS